jgi:SAM-dependent methyltransferase
MAAEPNVTARFTGRAGYYSSYRPRYPDQVVTHLEDEGVLKTGSLIADIGAGTGISSELLLRRGYGVVAVEPNEDMRKLAEASLARYPGYSSTGGTAEDTKLEAASVDCVLAAQAFHWFDPPRARREFRRVLRPGGRVVLLWNRRRKGVPFLEAYEQLLRDHCPDYVARQKKDREEIHSTVADFYGGHGAFRFLRIDNSRLVEGFDALLGGVMSASYAPLPGDWRHATLVDGLRVLFDRFAVEGRLSFEYDLHIYWGGLE